MPITKVLFIKRFDSTSSKPEAFKRNDIADILEVGREVGVSDHLEFQPVLQDFADEAEYETFRQEVGKSVEDPADRMTVDLDDAALFPANIITDSSDRRKAMRPVGNPIPPPVVGQPFISAGNQVEATQTVRLTSSNTLTRRARGLL